MTHLDRDWNARYQLRETPWDSGIRSSELARVLEQLPELKPPARVLELGCGTGTNAVFLAQQGFEVTAVDVAPAALDEARQKARASGVTVRLVKADVQNWGTDEPPSDFLFDRGCYHCCRRVDPTGYLKTLENVSQPGTWFLCLCGNPNEAETSGPPRVSEEEIRRELGSLFEIVQLREFRFEDPGGVPGPLGWSVLMRRND